MAIKSITDNKPPVKPFPKLMIISDRSSANFGTVVLFNHNECGTVVHAGGKDYDIGLYLDSWVMSGFSDYNEHVTLVNE